ncbi:hypothetical protein HAX54_014179, partial [Datura stramonium]|nr:hypothetical protein [Datura stramonium]
DGVGVDKFSPSFCIGCGGEGYSPNDGGDFGSVGDGGEREGFSTINEKDAIFRGYHENFDFKESSQAIIQNFGSVYTPDVVKRRKIQISKEMTSAKKKRYEYSEGDES